MKGKLISFNPYMVNGQHDQYKEFYKFTVEIEVDGSRIGGESMAKNKEGSRAWKIGETHEFEKIEAKQAYMGTRIKGLKSMESIQAQAARENNNTPGQPLVRINSQKLDFEKESYLISRFAHGLAKDHLQIVDPETKKAYIDKFGETKMLSGLAMAFAESIVNTAKHLITKNESQAN